MRTTKKSSVETKNSVRIEQSKSLRLLLPETENEWMSSYGLKVWALLSFPILCKIKSREVFLRVCKINDSCVFFLRWISNEDEQIWKFDTFYTSSASEMALALRCGNIYLHLRIFTIMPSYYGLGTLKF